MTDSDGTSIDPQAGKGPVVSVTLDGAALAKLRELDPDGSRGVTRRVLTTFDSLLVRWLGQLAGNAGPVDAAALGMMSHTLKSSASSVGAQELARACADVERRLRTGGLVDLPAEIQRLSTQGQAALLAVRAILRA